MISHPRRARPGHHGAGLPADIRAGRPVQRAARVLRTRLPGQPWIGQESTALPVIMAVTVWHWTGITFVLYFAAMGQIDQSTIEAARIDGAGNFRTLVHIIWPGVRGTTLAMAILSAIGALKTFDIPYLITVGGPNYATEFLGTYIYRKTIPQSHVGYGAALSIILLVLALVMALILQVRGEAGGPLMFEVRTRWGRILLQVIVTFSSYRSCFPGRDGAGLPRGRRLGQLCRGPRRPRPRALLRQHRGHRGRGDRHRLSSPCSPPTASGSCVSGGARCTSGCCWPASRCRRWCSSRRCSPPPRRSASSTPTGRDPAAGRAAGAVRGPARRNFVQGIPDELFEAARVDGGSASRASSTW